MLNQRHIQSIETLVCHAVQSVQYRYHLANYSVRLAPIVSNRARGHATPRGCRARAPGVRRTEVDTALTLAKASLPGSNHWAYSSVGPRFVGTRTCANRRGVWIPLATLPTET